jgi:DNA-directed RNA polymerase subunit RPC12/RpoP
MLEEIQNANPDALLADGFEKAIIGIASRCAMNPVVVYDYELCTGILMQRDHMTYEEACEFMDFNVVGAYVGENGPLFLQRLSDEEIEAQNIICPHCGSKLIHQIEKRTPTGKKLLWGGVGLSLFAGIGIPIAVWGYFTKETYNECMECKWVWK